jgi:membrane-bound metal-dependent hydrolase YbcI (DUF457 family)
MTFAFGHMIGAWCLGLAYQFISKKKLSHLTWFFLFVGGILPDTDFLLDWLFGTGVHRSFTHSFLFVLLAPILLYGLFILIKKFEILNKIKWLSIIKRKEIRYFAYALGGGILTHLILDSFSGQGVPLLWPSPVYFSFFRVGFYDPAFAFLAGSNTVLLHKIKLMTLDMGLGTLWFFYLWLSKKIGEK